ncbi:hypothetical protein [Proteocatella sphenisci]|uniref:hypothetical protein n=1 Tax=Proteocatella sphenisci TaxID=181070 RepID=UPI00048CC390|nr:hypothetical protein [Proteocatella sphenisci]
MIDQLEKLKGLMNGNDNEIESMYGIILAVATNIVPCTIFIFFYKRSYFIEWDLWKLILISISLTSPIYMLNYWIINMQISINILSSPQKLAHQAYESVIKNQTKKSSEKYSDEKVREIIIDELYTTLTTKNKNTLYITSKKMLIVFSITLIGFYYLNLSEYLLQNKLLIFLYIELIFFIIPTISDGFALKKKLKEPKDREIQTIIESEDVK